MAAAIFQTVMDNLPEIFIPGHQPLEPEMLISFTIYYLLYFKLLGVQELK